MPFPKTPDLRSTVPSSGFGTRIRSTMIATKQSFHSLTETKCKAVSDCLGAHSILADTSSQAIEKYADPAVPDT